MRNIILASIMGFSVPVMAREKYRPYRLEGAFICDIPSSWTVWRDESEDRRLRIHGTIVFRPSSTAGVPPRLTVQYYPPDNTLFKGPDDYLARQLAEGPVKLKGGKARTFRRETFAYASTRSTAPKEIKITEERVVLEHSKGFFVIALSAPRTEFKRLRPFYQRAVDTLRPLTGS